MDALQEPQAGSQASTRTTLPRASARLMGAPLTHEDGASEPNSGTAGPTGEQAARAATRGKIEGRCMVLPSGWHGRSVRRSVRRRVSWGGGGRVGRGPGLGLGGGDGFILGAEEAIRLGEGRLVLANDLRAP